MTGVKVIPLFCKYLGMYFEANQRVSQFSHEVKIRHVLGENWSL